MPRTLKSHGAHCVLVVLVFAFALSTQASLLNLNADAPDFMASFVNLSYNSTNGSFSALGFTTDYQGGSATLMDLGNYSLTANISSAGVLSSGSLTIQGDIGSGVETLLNGTLNTGANGIAFGSETTSDPSPRNIFEFLFTVTGGNSTIVSDFGGLGAANRGVILNAFFQNGGVPFTGNWTSSFHNNGNSGVSDNFVQVPEPSVAALLLAGAIFVRRRCLKRSERH